MALSEASPSERQAAIATLRALADLPSDDAAAALLASTNWDLQAAADAFLSGATDAAQNSGPAAAPPAPRPQRRVARRAPAPAWAVFLFSPLRAAWDALSRAAAAFMSLLGGHARAIEAAPGNTHTERFLAFLDERYGIGERRPSFVNGGFLEALSRAQAQNTFLVVYLHSEAHPATGEFVRRVLSSPEFVDAVDSGYVCWAGSITQPDAAAVQHALRVDSFPFLGVVAAPRASVRTGLSRLPPLGSQNYGNLLARLNGGQLLRRYGRDAGDDEGGADRAAGATVEWLMAVQAEHVRILEAVGRERAERENTRALRREQDEEYAAALAADRAREAEEREREERKREQTRAEEEQAAAAGRRKEELETRRRRKRDALPAEPEKAPGIATVVLRLPDGEKKSRRFSKNDVLELVFDWAEGDCGVDVEVAALVSSYPRKSFRYPEDASETLESVGFFPSAMLLLEERTDVVSN